jgi:RimJ/RimL family protein N-acetyltransferase
MNLEYRRFNITDFSSVFELESNADVMKFTGPGRALTEEESHSRFNKLLSANYDDPFGYWCVTVNKKFVAWLMLIPDAWEDTKAAEIGFMVHPKFWNLGIAKSLVKKIEKDILDMKIEITLKAVVSEENVSSLKIFKSDMYCEASKDGLVVFERNFFCPKSF